MKQALSRLIFLGFLFSAACTADASEMRRALVIGNSAYLNVGELKNPENDALLISKKLKEAGFEVVTHLDANNIEMRQSIERFVSNITELDAVAVFYYAGHAVQVNGNNYLVPVDASVEDESRIKNELVSVYSVLKSLEASQSRINVIILDACRNNPFKSKFRSTQRGLAPFLAPRGTYIAYATAPGEVALDGDRENSPYTLALANTLLEPGLTIEQVFKKTRRQVLQSTQEKQVPWESSSIVGEFYFVHGEKKRDKIVKPFKPVIVPDMPQIIDEAPKVKEDCFKFNGRLVCD